MKNYLIIGGSSGIGKELVDILSNQQHQVYSTYFNNTIEESSLGVNYQYLNVMDEDIELKELPDIIDGFVYCPGSINLKPFSRISPKAFVEDFQLQVIGAIKTLKSILPKLKAAEKASIVFFSTVAVQTGFNFHSQVSVSKGAIEGLTKSLAAELSPNIRVNTIAPSLTDTPLSSRLLNTEAKLEANAERHPLKRIGAANDIAEMAAFLLSDKSTWMTGQIIHVDGGMSTVKV